MNRKLLCLLVSILCMGQMMANTVYYDNQDLHLLFTLDTQTKEATLGYVYFDPETFAEYVDEHTALSYPDMNDPYWDQYPHPQLWDPDFVIPDTIIYEGEKYAVVAISSYAFYRDTHFRSMTLPNTIRRIGHHAFAWQVNMKSINIPEGVSYIGASTFELCRALDSIHLPSTITAIEPKAFFNCNSLKKINIPGNCLSIGQDAFTWDDSLSTLIIEDGDSVLSMDYAYAVGYDYSVMGSYLHNNALFNGPFFRGLFADCALYNIYVGRNLNMPVLPGNKHYSAFEDIWSDQLDDYENPILHRNGKYWKNIKFGPKVTTIPDNIFSFGICSGEIALPSNVQYVGSSAFYDCTVNTTHLTIPASCDTIGPNAFTVQGGKTMHLTHVDCLKPTPPRLGGNIAMNGFIFKRVFVTVPAGAGSLYRNAPYWRNNLIIDPTDELVTINVRYPGSLYGRILYEDHDVTNVYRLKLTGTLNEDDWAVVNSMYNLYELDLSEMTSEVSVPLTLMLEYYRGPNTQNIIAYGQYRNQQLPDTLVIPANIVGIEGRAFQNASIKHLIVEGQTSISGSAFVNCQNLKSVELLGEGVYLCTGAFDSTNVSLQSVVINKGVTIADKAFKSCKSLEFITIEDSITSIGEQAFVNAPIKRLSIEGVVESFGDSILSHAEELYVANIGAWCNIQFSSARSNPIKDCDKVFIGSRDSSSVVIPQEIDTVNDYAFINYASLKSVILPEGVIHIGRSCFENDTNLMSINIPSSVDTILPSAFKNCRSIQTVLFPESIDYISDSCFINCSNLQKVLLSSALKRVGKSSFNGCSMLDSIVFPSGIQVIGESAFQNCERISQLSFPVSVQEVGQNAFTNCSNLTKIKAKWLSPISIPNNAFDNISRRCCLWVPFGAAPVYYTSGWNHIPLIDEGFYALTIQSGFGGNVEVEDICVRNSMDAYLFEDNIETADISIHSDEDYYVQDVQLGDSNITNVFTFTNDHVTVDNVQNNLLLNVIFARYYLGDANDDNYVDIGDITAVVNDIKQTPMGRFIALAADVNKDKEINVGDITGIVNLIYEEMENGQTFAPTRQSDLSISGEYSIHSNVIHMESNQQVQVPIYLENTTSVSGFQFEVVVPEGFEVPIDANGNYQISFNTGRTANMNITSISQLANGHILVLCTSSYQTMLTDNSGLLATITLSPLSSTPFGEYEVLLTNVKIADTQAHVTALEESITLDYQLQVPTDIESIDGKKSKDGKYLEEGHLVIYKNGEKYDVLGLKK